VASASGTDTALETLWDSRQDCIPWTVCLFESESSSAKTVYKRSTEEL